MNIYLLDKNVVEDIRKYNLSETREISPAINYARRIDRVGYLVSPLLSILEGRYQKTLTNSQLHDNVYGESLAVASFYKNARTDASFLNQMAASFASAFGPHYREKIEDLIPMTLDFQKILARTYTTRDARQALQEIIAISNKNLIGTAHPLTLCAVTCLYGNTYSRKVLKPTLRPTERTAFNAIADIRLLMETAYIRHVCSSSLLGNRVFLYTRDVNLRELDHLFAITALQRARSEMSETIAFTSTLADEMFSALKQKPKELAYVKEQMAHGVINKT